LRRQHEDLDDQADFDFEMGETYDEELQNDLRLFRGGRYAYAGGRYFMHDVFGPAVVWG